MFSRREQAYKTKTSNHIFYGNMGEKRNLLEKKTVEELKQMAKYKSFSGYSNKNKSELIELIKDQFTESEIKNWPDFGLREVGNGSETGLKEERPKLNVGIKEVEAAGNLRKREDLIYVISATGSVIAGTIALALLCFYLW